MQARQREEEKCLTVFWGLSCRPALLRLLPPPRLGRFARGRRTLLGGEVLRPGVSALASDLNQIDQNPLLFLHPQQYVRRSYA